MEVSLLDIAYIHNIIATYLYTFIDIIYLCALKHYCIRTFVFVLVALLLVKIFDGGFNGLTILNLLPTGLFVLHISGTAALLLVLVN